VTLPLFNCARDLKSSKRFVRVAVEEYGCLFVVADCEGAGGEERRGEERGERGVIAEFEMVVDERQTNRQMKQPRKLCSAISLNNRLRGLGYTS
jgi:hypothetical protein